MFLLSLTPLNNKDVRYLYAIDPVELEAEEFISTDEYVIINIDKDNRLIKSKVRE